MAMSCYPNWEELQEGHYLNSEMSFFNPSLTELSPELLLGFDSINNIYGFPESCTHDPFSRESQELFPVHEYEPYPYLKRQKGYETGSFSSEIIPGLHESINGFAIFQSPSFFQEPFPDFVSNPPVFRSKPAECKKKSGTGSGSGGSLSAQSMAARERRRKITEKTQELGKLIPASSQKMNTAEMFQAAFKYIKFLQAQVGILEAMSSSVHQKNVDSFAKGEIGRLLASSLIQEKLYTAEKCLVPKKLFQSLANHHKL